MSAIRLQRFEKDFGAVDLTDFYQLNKDFETVHIEKTIHSDCIQLSIHYKKNCPSLDLDLPFEMNEKIREYLIYDIEIRLKIKYSPSYPFSPPVWFLEGVYHNLPTERPLFYYYSHKVSQHNKSYTDFIISHYLETAWTPAITVEKDILSFVQKVNHFDEVIDCI